jgi:SAM-dependent methyltransferase
VAGDGYLDVNRANWDERAPAHAASADYAVEQYVADPTFIGDVVRFDRPRLGDLTGVRGIHLQCHIGTDTISLSRLGARMTGVDFSSASLDQARRLVERSGDEVDFVRSDVYDAVAAVRGEQFDLVFTGIGALCWLPSIRRWAKVVGDLLRPGGRLFLREGHPMLWSLDETILDGELVVAYPYFEREEPTVFDEEGTYVETDVEFEHTLTHEWNHGLGELITALLDNGLRITALEEHDSVPWDPLPGSMEPHPDHPGELRLRDRRWRLPLTYTLQATKDA